MTVTGRRAKRFLSAEQKYDLWVRMLTGQLTAVQAAAEAGVDRTTIATFKRVARDGAIAALEASRPGAASWHRGENGRAGPSAWRGRPVAGRDRGAGDRARGVAGKSGLGMSGPVPARVDGAAKAVLLDVIDEAVEPAGR